MALDVPVSLPASAEGCSQAACVLRYSAPRPPPAAENPLQVESPCPLCLALTAYGPT